MEIQQGDMFFTCWGYDQTQYDFLMVLGFTQSGKTAICQMIKRDIVNSSQTHYEVKPKPERYGDKFRMKVLITDGSFLLRGSYPFCQGKLAYGRRLDTFCRTDGKHTFYETNPIAGH